MDREGYRQTKRILLEALALHGETRQSYLAEACAGDDELLAEVLSLLARDGASENLAGSVQPVSTLLDHASPPPPERIGPYTITGVLGEGGMGVVYRGRQEEPIRRDVAVKVLRAGFDTARVLERFAWERRSLARMDHPHIARILDAGSDEAGRPFVVLELVDGVPITTFAREQGVDLDARLALVAKVCRAVQHAHDRGVLHRDLKPGNVLVREVDGAPVPAVIDFGIAKALDDTDRDLTLDGQRVGTPSYMSPEQLGGGEVDVRSDVYALGCILYQLVAGRKPVTGDPDQASVVAPSRAAAAGSIPWRRRLRGDLDRICLMAIRPESARRYASAAALAEDLDRFAAGRPVTATPDSWNYRARKAARRHPLRVALATAALGFVVAGIAFLGYHAERLERERSRALEAEASARSEAAAADRIADFLEGLFTESDPAAGGAAETTARELLDQGTARLKNERAGPPRIRGRLFGVMGRVHHGMGLHDRAEELLRQSLADLAKVPDSTAVTAERAEVYAVLGTALHDLGRYGESETAYRRSYRLYRQVHREPHTDLVWALVDLATSIQGQGRLDEAVPLMEEAVVLGLAVGPDADRAVAWTRNMLGYMLAKRGRLRQALEIFADAYAAQRAVITGDDIELINTLNNLGNVSLALGNLDEAERRGTEALAMVERIYPGDHPAVARALKNLGLARQERGDLAAADSLLTAAHAMNLRTLGEEHRHAITTLVAVSRLRGRQGRATEAETGLRRALILSEEHLGPDHDRTLRVHANLGSHYLDNGAPERARIPLELALAAYEVRLEPDHPRLNEIRVDLGATLLALGERDEARALLATAAPHLEAVYGDTHRHSVRAGELLAGAR